MANVSFFQVDAFTDIPFKGNPAAICLIEKELPDSFMQQIAAENNLSETAFALRAENGFGLRWFTPTVEIKLCGHATLATAHVLWEQGIIKQDETARFFTLSGLLTVIKKGNWIELDFPRFSYTPVDVPDGMVKALGILPVNAVRADDGRYIIEIENAEQLLAMNPDFSILKTYPSVAVTSKAESDSPYDFLSRSFAPSHGVNEDSVTGSSHCCLAPYWAEKLQKTELFAFQASERGGELRLRLAGERVLIEGKAVTVIEGTFRYEV